LELLVKRQILKESKLNIIKSEVIYVTDNKYYCQNCGAEIKSTDTVCPKCGKNLSEVGRRILVTVTETISLSDEVKTELSPAQRKLVEKVYQKIKDFVASKEIESITINFGFIVIVIKGKKESS
jgi:tRNA(Ile2) C34 agmatinyltransferase TiaS